MLGRKAQQIILTASSAHLHLYIFSQLKNVTHRAKYRLLRDLKGAEVESLVLALAESIAEDTSGEKGTLPLSTVPSELITYFFEEYPQVKEKSLLSGNEIMEALQLKPGEEIGKILAHIENAERRGTVSTKEDALAVIRSLHRTSNSHSKEKEEAD
jgi:tRNA nucleotidyltransferase (CCA-adding enzyme)